MEYSLLTVFALIALIIISGFFAGRYYGWIGKRESNINGHGSPYLKEIIERDRQIKNLNVRINKLAELNSRYLSFMFKVPSVIQRLNTTLKLQEIVLSIIELVSNIVLTDKVELFMFDASNNRLEKFYVNGKKQEEKIFYALGEGIIGTAAEHRFVILRDQFNRIYNKNQVNGNSEPQYWMAVPIIFKDRLLGVIGIGEIETPTGNESDMLKMIADMAGVALFNQIVLNDAQHKANTDALTGLNNRNYFFQMADRYVEKSLRDGTAISVFLFDIDNFKQYNDTNGHNEGDKLLVELSRLLRGASRKDATVARYGGEEFLVMLPGISKEKAFTYAERLREMISQHAFQHREKQPLGFISISGGVACFPEDGDSINKVIQLADVCLYQAKSAGKNRVFMNKTRQLQPDNMQIEPIASKIL
jgi:diguanylate cyclase (GGDEF)-like protein